MTAVSAFMESVRDRMTWGNVIALGLLFSSSLIASVVIYLHASSSDRSLGGFTRFAMPRDILSHSSARADFLFWVTRKVLMPLLLVPSAVTMIIAVGYATHTALAYLIGPGSHGAGPAGPLTICLFTVTMLLAYDLSYYVYHYAQHRFPVLWELHKVHHSAEVLVGVTKDRIHPLDEIMNRTWDGLVVGAAYGVWLFFALDPVEATIFGINVYVMRNILMMDFVRHTHLKVSFGRWINAVIICPHYHQLHHSTDSRHFNRNFGLMLSVWDRLFGTLLVPQSGESFSFGLGQEGREYQSMSGLYLLPLRRMATRAISTLRRTHTGSTRSGDAPIRIEIVQAGTRLMEIEAAWGELWRSSEGSIFQSFDWINAWWRNAGARDGYRLHFGLAWTNSQLVAAFPLVSRRYRGVRVLEWAAKDCSDYCDVLAAPIAKDATLGEVWRAVSATGGFDVAYLSHVRDQSRLSHVTGRESAIFKLREASRYAVSTGVQLRGWTDGEAWLKGLGKKGRNNRLRGWRILEQAGTPTFRLVSTAQEIEPALERLCTLKQGWLEAQGLSSPVLRHQAVLLRALVRALAATGRLRLFLLETDGEVVAGSVNILENDVLMAFFTAYDPSYGRASPGMLLMIEYIRWSFNNGVSEVSFLCGDESYKDRFVNVRERLTSFTGAHTLFGWFAMIAYECAELSGRLATLARPGVPRAAKQ